MYIYLLISEPTKNNQNAEFLHINMFSTLPSAPHILPKYIKFCVSHHFVHYY